MRKIVLALAITLGLTACGAAPAGQLPSPPVEANMVVAPAGEVSIPFETIPPVEPRPMTDIEWVYHVVESRGLSFGNIPVEVTDVGNCGVGCTGVKIVNNQIVEVHWVKISPSVIGTPLGEHVVLHELGHVSGAINECRADDFAKAHGAIAVKDAHCYE